VIVHAEIALEPDTDGRAGVRHDDQILFTQDPGPAEDNRQQYSASPDPATFLGRGSAATATTHMPRLTPGLCMGT
jgi:hypothetical protein